MQVCRQGAGADDAQIAVHVYNISTLKYSVYGVTYLHPAVVVHYRDGIVQNECVYVH